MDPMTTLGIATAASAMSYPQMNATFGRPRPHGRSSSRPDATNLRRALGSERPTKRARTDAQQRQQRQTGMIGTQRREGEEYAERIKQQKMEEYKRELEDEARREKRSKREMEEYVERIKQQTMEEYRRKLEDEARKEERFKREMEDWELRERLRLESEAEDAKKVERAKKSEMATQMKAIAEEERRRIIERLNQPADEKSEKRTQPPAPTMEELNQSDDEEADRWQIRYRQTSDYMTREKVPYARAETRTVQQGRQKVTTSTLRPSPLSRAPTMPIKRALQYPSDINFPPASSSQLTTSHPTKRPDPTPFTKRDPHTAKTKAKAKAKTNWTISEDLSGEAGKRKKYAMLMMKGSNLSGGPGHGARLSRKRSYDPDRDDNPISPGLWDTDEERRSRSRSSLTNGKTVWVKNQMGSPEEAVIARRQGDMWEVKFKDGRRQEVKESAIAQPVSRLRSRSPPPRRRSPSSVSSPENIVIDNKLSVPGIFPIPSLRLNTESRPNRDIYSPSSEDEYDSPYVVQRRRRSDRRLIN